MTSNNFEKIDSNSWRGEFLDRCEARRKTVGVQSMRDLSVRSNLNPDYLRDIRRGVIPNALAVYEIARVLRCSTSFLIEGVAIDPNTGVDELRMQQSISAVALMSTKSGMVFDEKEWPDYVLRLYRDANVDFTDTTTALARLASYLRKE
jgi:hypothetical protein